ncbi:hypothetical protein [Salirhabdus sp. Marseille-P4669]|uniref:hypothetical protein n=1 Tax=Salirhabdus sp. Marseille-P4669 TaxID=2042310 RepID=UPI0011AF61E0|nr:hypothetical protein [Salirhabdus sp. Marseille-P4669]
MNKLLILNLTLLLFLSAAVTLYTLDVINDSLVALFVVPISVYFLILKERAVVKPSNQLKKEYRGKRLT